MFIEEALKERVLQHWQGIFLQWFGRAAPKTLELQTPWTVRTLQSAETRCLVREVHHLVHNHHLEMRNWFWTRVLFPVWCVSKRTALYCTIFCPDSTMCRDYPRSRYNGIHIIHICDILYHAFVSCGWLPQIGHGAMIDLATSKGKRKAPKSSDAKPAKPAKSKSAKARAKPNPGATRPRMEGSLTYIIYIYIIYIYIYTYV